MTTTTADQNEPMQVNPQYVLRLRRKQQHERCVVCGTDNDHGLGLECVVSGEGAVAGVFQAEPWMAGYGGQMHGGIIASLLDSAMVQCLFAHDHVAITATLSVRYLKLAPLGARYTVEAEITETRSTRHRMRARLLLYGGMVAEAKALFLDR